MRARGGALGVGVLLFWVAVLLASASSRGHFLRNADHGFQLGLGSQVLFGKTPGFDTFNHYGPAVPYVSALAQLLTGSLVGEVVVCSLGYGLALFLIYHLVAGVSGPRTGGAASVVAFVLLARFYKWYVWLLPLCVLWALVRFLECGPGKRARSGALLGLAVGATWLFRLDLGSTCFVGSFVLVAAVGWRELRTSSNGRRDVARALAAMALAFGATIAVWFLFLALREGPAGCVYFLRSTLGGAMGTKAGMGTGFPAFDPSSPWSAASIRAIALALLFAGYAVGLTAGARAEAVGRATACSRLLLASAVVGLSTVHQSLHRVDEQHILQVMPPALVLAFVLVVAIARRTVEASPGRRAILLTAGVGLVIAWGVVVAGLSGRAREDLERFDPWPVGRYEELADPLRDARTDSRALPLQYVREITTGDMSILAFPLDPQAYFFAGRRMSGKMPAYYPGIFCTPPWSTENQAELLADMPAVVIVQSGFFDVLAEDDELHRHRTDHAQVERLLRQEYTRVLFDDGETLLLARPERRAK